MYNCFFCGKGMNLVQTEILNEGEEEERAMFVYECSECDAGAEFFSPIGFGKEFEEEMEKNIKESELMDNDFDWNKYKYYTVGGTEISFDLTDFGNTLKKLVEGYGDKEKSDENSCDCPFCEDTQEASPETEIPFLDKIKIIIKEDMEYIAILKDHDWYGVDYDRNQPNNSFKEFVYKYATDTLIWIGMNITSRIVDRRLTVSEKNMVDVYTNRFDNIQEKAMDIIIREMYFGRMFDNTRDNRDNYTRRV